MAKFFGLDIPSGLETAFYNALTADPVSSKLALRYRPSTGTSVKKRSVISRSLFVKWQSLYNGFTTGRRASWDAFWATLPFGDHSGADGWPGSGYSAFVYINAPRYRMGLALLYDPPSTNILLNGDFNGNADHWVLNTSDYFCGPMTYYDDFSLKWWPNDFDDLSIGEKGVYQDSLPLVDGGWYSASIKLAIPDFYSLTVYLGEPGADEGDYAADSFRTFDSNAGVLTQYDFSIRANVEPGVGDWYRFTMAPGGFHDVPDYCSEVQITVKDVSLIPDF